MIYNKPFDATNPAAGYVNGNPATNTAGSIPCAEGLEYPQREIVAVIQAANLVPTNNDLTQLLQAIQALAGSKGLTVINNRKIVGSTRRIFMTVGLVYWTVPDGITQVDVEGCWGPGGGGAGGSMAAGAGGGFAAGTYTVTPGQVIPVTIGAPGVGTAGSFNSTNPGGNGGTTSFGSFCSATGGQGGGAGATAGGQGSGGDINLQGASGLDLDGTNSYAAGGAAPFGGGPAQTTAQFPGGGGGASTNALNSSIPNAGYNGALGAVIIRF
ncbi:hypothetical protein [Methylobacterium sp. 1973]|uniref:glycine-rich domain-containing protein n=1 Tax=Methylobacterium sp. 1973 TaxID=3156421 RepID=UPI00339AED29